jgi:four helix bundle suffix protein
MVPFAVCPRGHIFDPWPLVGATHASPSASGKKITPRDVTTNEELRLDYRDYLRQRGMEEWPPNHPALLRFKAKRCATLAEIQAWAQEERQIARTSTDPPTPTDREVRVGPYSCPLESCFLARNSVGIARRALKPKELGLSQRREDRKGQASIRAFFSWRSWRLGERIGFGCGRRPRWHRPRPSVPTSAQLAANAALSLLNLSRTLLKNQLRSQAAQFEAEGGFTERLHRVRTQNRRTQGRRDAENGR